MPVSQMPAKDNDEDKKGAEVKFPPPLIFLLLMLVAYGLHYWQPFTLGMPMVGKYIGLFIALLAVTIVIYISRIFLHVNTSIEPWKPTTTIISTGIYAYSRNPIYALFCFIPIGIGMFLNSAWVLISFIPGAILVYLIAIRKEEAYLEQKFGEEYLQYKRKVRRWL